jgi:hypothetical protein
VGPVNLNVIGVALIVAATQAAANDLAPTQPKQSPPHAASKAVRPAQSSGSGLADIPFSKPYAPPVGKATSAEFPAKTTAPVDPKGNLSFTYKWKANNEPTDPYWTLRSAPGAEAPGDTFLGGLKLGF